MSRDRQKRRLIMKSFVKRNAVILRNYGIFKKYSFLASVAHREIPLDPNSKFVISVASYPGRIHFVPAVFESLAYQSILPKHAYLILAEEEWPSRELPKYIDQLVERGLQIVWTRNNPYSVKMLVPILDRNPDLGIVTLADDMIYSTTVLEGSVCAQNIAPGSIVGHIGHAIYRKGDQLSMKFREPGLANHQTPACQVYLKGCGAFYPSKSLHPSVVDIDAINRIVPGRGSDIWFWAAAVAAGTNQVCLGRDLKRLWIPIPQSKRSQPRDLPGGEVVEQRFQRAIDFFGIRERLLKTLPDIAGG